MFMWPLGPFRPNMEVPGPKYSILYHQWGSKDINHPRGLEDINRTYFGILGGLGNGCWDLRTSCIGTYNTSQDGHLTESCGSVLRSPCKLLSLFGCFYKLGGSFCVGVLVTRAVFFGVQSKPQILGNYQVLSRILTQACRGPWQNHHKEPYGHPQESYVHPQYGPSMSHAFLAFVGRLNY